MRVRISTKKLIWYPEIESDEDGYVRQETFVLSASQATDEHGNLTNLPEDGLGDYVTDGATRSTATFQGSIRRESQLEDGLAPVAAPAEESLSLQPLERAQWLKSIIYKRPDEILEDIWLLIKIGERIDNRVGHQR